MDSSPAPLASTRPRRSNTSADIGALDKDHPLRFIEALIDPGMLVLTLWAVGLYHEGSLRPGYLVLSVIVFSMTFPGTSQIHSSMVKLVVQTLINWIAVGALLLTMGVATGYIHQFSIGALLTWMWMAPLAQIAAHRALRVAAPAVLAMRGPSRKAVIVGMNTQGIALARRIRDTPYSGIEVKGFFDDRSLQRLNAPMGFGLLGPATALPGFVKAQGIQIIYLSLPMASQPRILELLDELKDTTASIYFVPDMFFTDLIQARLGHVCGTQVISVRETPFRGINGILKRSSDIVLSLLILALIWPILLVLACAVRFTSPGPVIFRQHRYGLAGEKIVVYKFRSMTVTEDGDSVQQAQRGDSRITPLGAFMRRTSLDELPQFINVLQGRMSIVGPRPHAVSHNETYRRLIKGYMVRHKVKPGITGWAQVNGCRGETRTLEEMQDRIHHDLDYLRNWSLRLDLYIIMKTIRLVFRDSQAY
ncbi:undecaprenyl-phosphate glucose phosphotransferase [Pseudorhodoferax aquiterrae]|uniref:Undecaprenyl-phosphate glucose phosphotransferase n=1 Tax=Pseudorhodoferax aquiterrae TaxID=747304 RepID=A0ABQ3FZY1_9BURK|nr:undecaprenyl-phosphate glucose phosphotransferase [Pseudorhodoferax aquiterrae]GHC79731.1 undecaprenyl-phosphate glucose phosphotransferase [Pseudorhodoferax aquiterrae]